MQKRLPCTEQTAVLYAQRILKALHIHSTPVGVVELLNALEFNTFAYNADLAPALSFVTATPKSGRCIAVCKANTFEENRYLLACELAHYLFEFDNNEQCFFHAKSSLSDSEVVYRFATELLLPEKAFVKRHKALRKYQGYMRVHKLAEQFQMPVETVRQRCQQLFPDAV